MTLFDRRIRAEWEMLLELAANNPSRITGFEADDSVFSVRLLATPALQLNGAGAYDSANIITEHTLRIDFPMHYPAVPLTLHLAHPVLHPNIHPKNGFVCLWTRHHLNHNVEHAMHKTVAMLGWRLYNTNAEHVMQPESLPLLQKHHDEWTSLLHAEPLQGLTHSSVIEPATPLRRMRLS